MAGPSCPREVREREGWRPNPGAAILVLLALAAAHGSDDLPPEGYVRLLRLARITADDVRREAILEQAVQDYPERLAARLELDLLHRQQRAGKSADAALPPLDLGGATISYAEAYRLARDTTTSREHLEHLEVATRPHLSREPVEERWQRLAAQLRFRLGDEEGARDLLGRMLAANPGRALRGACIQLDLALERWDDALALIRAQGQVEDSEFLRRQLIRALAGAGEHQELMESLGRLVDGELFSPALVESTLIPAAWSLWDAGHAGQAEQLFRTLLERHPEHPDLRRIVDHLFATPEERASGDAGRAWEDEDDPVRLVNEAANLLSADDAESALKLLQRAVALMPESEPGWLNLGLAASRLERWEQADEAYSRSLALQPDSSSALFSRGLVRVKMGHCPEAIPDLERTLELDPGRRNAHYYLARCYQEAGEMEKAAAAQKRYEAQP